MAVLRDTATLFWGEAEAPIEQAAFRLKKGECSPVVKASTGFYILHVERDVPNSFYTSMQPQVLFERVETKLRLRKENARLDEYIQNILKTKTGFSLPRSFKIIAKALTDAWKKK
jgi:parvulin-like peptidyl-prolyl isomerase